MSPGCSVTTPRTAPKHHHPLALWLRVRTAYIHGEGALPALSERFHIPLTTLQSKAKAQKWGVERKLYVDSKRMQAIIPQPPTPPALPGPCGPALVKGRHVVWAVGVPTPACRQEEEREWYFWERPDQRATVDGPSFGTGSNQHHCVPDPISADFQADSGQAPKPSS